MSTDLTSAKIIEVMVRKHGDAYRMWVNVDGVCQLRAYRVDKIVIDADPEFLLEKVEMRADKE